MEKSSSPAANRVARAVVFWICSLLFLVGIGWFDYVTGYDLHVFAFYFLPVWILGWYVNFKSSVVMAVLSAGTWLMADYMSGHIYPHPAIGYWNGAMDLVACLVVAVTTHIARQQFLKQQELHAELLGAATTIKQLEGMLHICAFCKRIRNDRNEWEQLEKYFTSHSDTSFSHGYCPDCAQKFYPNLVD